MVTDGRVGGERVLWCRVAGLRSAGSVCVGRQTMNALACARPVASLRMTPFQVDAGALRAEDLHVADRAGALVDVVDAELAVAQEVAGAAGEGDVRCWPASRSTCASALYGVSQWRGLRVRRRPGAGDRVGRHGDRHRHRCPDGERCRRRR